MSDESGDDFDDLILMMTRECADFLKNLTGLADWARLLGLDGCITEQCIDADLQNSGNLSQAVGSECNVTPFPSGVRLLGDAKLVGDLCLAESLGFTGGVKA